jgi:hypothetical protein
MAKSGATVQIEQSQVIIAGGHELSRMDVVGTEPGVTLSGQMIQEVKHSFSYFVHIRRSSLMDPKNFLRCRTLQKFLESINSYLFQAFRELLHNLLVLKNFGTSCVHLNQPSSQLMVWMYLVPLRSLQHKYILLHHHNT